MNTKNKTPITLEASINAPIEKVWKCWTSPEDIMKWCNASNDWHAPKAENDLRTGGTFLTRMEAKDGSFGFDFEGKYTKVVPLQIIEYIPEDGRTVKISFHREGNETRVIETFDPENMNSAEMQKAGWQAILNNFKAYTESL